MAGQHKKANNQMLQKILILSVNFYKFLVSLWREFKVSSLFFVNPIVRDSFFSSSTISVQRGNKATQTSQLF